MRGGWPTGPAKEFGGGGAKSLHPDYFLCTIEKNHKGKTFCNFLSRINRPHPKPRILDGTKRCDQRGKLTPFT